ncbi:hypothetical protein A3F08_02940 [Candidatus Berkelbacteria bacterium RIFCSPHIGHO2_12_FULL_36_9]|uniref:Glycosyl transferase family 1 domain-containing protein n=1 Tax=Candidatus Berkelbacteria bacterium RIFCSPHIGHO2_12_FULL_36_9 TaxID=1797469 RepID=A0A1F5EE82_9BACT|nr:MAG: hypothetical protein A3F08_02940 [Candidatus Berkelbacteria bacterium RIFCSPHIGHO2_12_FULL_36_9]
MKIAIDCSKAVNEAAGIARYTENLTENLIKSYSYDQFFLYFNFMRGEEEKKEKIKSLIGQSKNVSYKIYHIPGWIKERVFSLPVSFTRSWVKNSDLVHATEFLSFDNGLKIPQILTIHDLTMIKFPKHRGSESIRHGKMLKKAAQNADYIIAVSVATKKDIVKLLHINEEKIKVIYNGKDNVFKPHKITEKEKKYLTEKYKFALPYILFLGTIEPRKNIANLLLAFDKFAHKNNKYYLILAGKKGWNTKEIEKVYKGMEYKNRVRFLDYVEQKDLPLIYNASDLFCYPSLYEGFGLPVLEAMACGTPVLTANISSLPEVGGSAAGYVDPKNTDEIYQAITKILLNKNLLRKMKTEGIRQAKKFSWAKCAKETHQVYEEIISHAKR